MVPANVEAACSLLNELEAASCYQNQIARGVRCEEQCICVSPLLS